MSNHHSFNVVIEEKFLQSKSGRLKDCEDLIHISENFIAVIDGATSKTGKSWNGKTGGQIAAQIIETTFNEMPYDYTAHQAVDLMTLKIKKFYKKENMLKEVIKDPSQRITAFFVAVSLYKQEIWAVGDCQFLLGGKWYSYPKLADQILAEVRAMVLQLELVKSNTYKQLVEKEEDKGRNFILPLLKNLPYFQNNPKKADQFWYPAVDGFKIPKEGIKIIPISNDINSIILATDGYPVLKSNRKNSDDELYKILARDPLLFREQKSTKGKIGDNRSFDDRAYIKIKVIH